MANDIQQLIKIIDSRVESKLSKTSTKFPAKVVTVLSASQSVVKLSNDDKEITFLNKTGEVLSVGDSVFIETIDGDLTGGFISERFGIPVLAGDGESGSMTASEILTLLKTVDGTGSGLDADSIDGQHGSYYLNRTNHTGTQAATTVTITDSGNNFTATDVEGALQELFTSVSNGKALIADAITDKGVTTSASDSFSIMATNINSISSGETPTTGQYLIRFIDYDGTILKEARVDIGGSVTPPSNPVHDGLTFQGWNYSSSAYTNVTADVDIGAMYITTDGKTKLIIKLTTVSGLTPVIYLNKSNTATMTIEWGDSSSETVTTSGNINKSHTYAVAGDYTISISITSGTGTYSFGNASSSTVVVGGADQNYRNTLLKANIGENVLSISNYAFGTCYSLLNITIPNNVTSIGLSSFQDCYSLSSVILPLSLTSLGNSVFRNCFCIVLLSIPSGITTLGSELFRFCYSLTNLIIPDSVTTLSTSAFGVCYSLRDIIIPTSVSSIGATAFQSCFKINNYILKPLTPPTLVATTAFSGVKSITKIFVPDASVSTYKAATNWSTYADYIYPISTM